MRWIFAQAEMYRAQIRASSFFHRLSQTSEVSDLLWTHQLLHQSREFTQALCLRYSLCRDARFRGIFAEHASEEADHPGQLAHWMHKHGLLESEDADPLPATAETIDSLAFCTRAAMRDAGTQVVVLNVLSEGVALDFYTAAIPVLSRLGALTGRYWKVHREVDVHHLQMGLDQLGDVSPASPEGQLYQRALHHAAVRYRAMLDSWAGVSTVSPIRRA